MRVVTCRCGQRMQVPDEALGKLGTCVRCRMRLEVTEFNSAPMRPEERTASPQPAANSNQCARCGRAFRGHWDQHDSAEGRICNICAKQYCVPGLEEAKPAPALPDNAWMNPAPLPPEEYARLAALAPSRWDRFKDQMADFRGSKWFSPVLLGVGVAAMMAFVLLLPVEEYAARFFSAAPPEKGEFPKALAVVILVLQQILSLAKYITILYLGLAWANKLPNDTFGKNLLAIGLVAVLLYALAYVPLLVPLFLGTDYLGAGAASLSTFTLMIFRCWLVFSLYDLEFFDLFRFMLISIFLSPLFMAIQQLVYGILAGLVY